MARTVSASASSGFARRRVAFGMAIVRFFFCFLGWLIIVKKDGACTLCCGVVILTSCASFLVDRLDEARIDEIQ
jgi:hypothetical protein